MIKVAHENGEVRVGLSVEDRLEIYDGGQVKIPHPTKNKDIVIYLDRDEYEYQDGHMGLHIQPEVDWPEMSTAINGGRKWNGRGVRLYWLSTIITGKEPMIPEHVERLIEATEPQ